jgi:hypothetical protein
LIRRQRLSILFNIISVKAFKSSFYLIKAAVEYKKLKVKMMKSLPKPRRKQWWEKLIEEEYDHFYEGKISMNQIPQ